MNAGLITCPGCGSVLPSRGLPPSENYHASGECEEAFNDLSGFTLSLYDPSFIHQHIVDAYGAQHCGPPGKNIRVVFSLVGLCLAIEKNFSGRRVQQLHMNIPKQEWILPGNPQQASITVADVINTPDENKNEMIIEWMKSVWQSWSAYHEWIRSVTLKYI